MKKIFVLVFTLISLFTVIPVKALEVDEVDLSKKGEIDITLSIDDNFLSNVEITIYKVASANIKNNNLVFEYNKELNNSIENIDKGILTNNELECILNANLKSISKKSDNKGNVVFEGLDLGLYLVVQSNDIDNYSKIKPFLLKIPTVSDKVWTYSISATPKIEIKDFIDLTVKKEWNVLDDSSIPDSVKVELLFNGEVLDEVKLNAENNWEYIWKHLENSDNYTIREIEIPEGFTATYRKDNNRIIITNTLRLAQTGDMPWIYEILGLIGIIIIMLGILLGKRDYEK